MDMALRSSLGVAPDELSREWKKNLRRKYWPLYADKKEAEEYGRKLTNHLKDHHYMNTKPVFSPDGEYIVYFSDRKGLDGIYLLNALSGKVEKRLVTGSLSERFESIRSMKSRLTFSPDGTMISFVAKSHGEDRLFVMEVPSGRIRDEIALPLDFFHSPSWSPGGDEIAIVGTIFGQTDLYIYDLQAGELRQLTSDPHGERDPSWFPDSRRLVFTRFPVSIVQPEISPDSTGVNKLNDVDFRSMDNLVHIEGDIWSYDLETGTMGMLISTPGNDLHPVVMPGEKEIIFTSNEKGVSNLYRGSVDAGSYYRFTDVLGGLFSPTYSPEKDRLAFTAFSYAGYDIFVMEGFSAKSKISYSTGSPALTEERSSREIRPEDYLVAKTESGEIAETDTAAVLETDATIAAATDSLAKGTAADADSIYVSATKEPTSEDLSVRVEGTLESPYERKPADEVSPRFWPIYQDERIPDFSIEQEIDEEIPPDSLVALREIALREIGTVKPYNLKFSPDYVGNGMGLFFSTGFGFGMVNQIAFSDLLGDHHLYFSFNIYRAFEDSDLMFSYYYLKKRIDYAVGAFQFKNYLNSRVSSVGETFLDYRLFTERNYGIFGLVSFPFSTFSRLDLELQAFISEREFFDTMEINEFGDYTLIPGERTTRRLVQPTLSLVHDSAYYGLFGPVIGSRWMLSVSRTIPFSGDDISRTTGFFDYRKYLPVFYRNYLAFRTMGAVSDGSDNKLFFLGGPLTMRGYDYLQLSGSRMFMASLEYRYPLLDALIFGWPGRWGIGNIGGTLFIDTGSVWGEDTYIEPIDPRIKPRTIEDINFYSDFGIGFYMRFGFLIMNFQIGWPTDFSRTGEPMYHFYLGPMF
jgi:Tol biopolymer transport system component